MGEIKVLEGGLLTTIQDRGRFGYQQYGMPAAGAMDEFSYRAANLLVQNHENTPALEATLKGPTLYLQSSAVLAITGATASPQLNGMEIPTWKSFYAEKGSILTCGHVTAGCRLYIAVAGGIDVPPVMGSCSTYLRGELGGFKGRNLQKGDVLPLGTSKEVKSDSGMDDSARYFVSWLPHQVVRVVPGPQDDHFTAESLKTFFSSVYTLTPHSDRMGCRLEGAKLKHKDSFEIVSDGMPHGAVQVPGHGHPIIMLSDRPTTGGYPKIATVISADIPKVAQLKPGEKISFQEVTLEKAQQLREEFEKQLYAVHKSTHKKEAIPTAANYLTYCVTVENRQFTVKVRKL